MAYFDVWKKKMEYYGANHSKSVENSSKAFVRRNFKYDPTYRSATIQKLDMTREPIDIRYETVDNTTTRNKIIFLPDTKVEVGSYIEYDQEIWLVREYQHKGLAPYAFGYYCNQTLNWEGLEKPIPCYAEDSAYNDKGEINLDYFSMVDGKVACYVPVNELTNQIEQNMRFTFNGDFMGVYEVISIKRVSVPTIHKIIMKKVEYFEGRDNLADNIAYNKEKRDWRDSQTNQNTTTTTTNTIVASSGDMSIMQYNAKTFTMMLNGQPSTEQWTISIEYGTVSQDNIKVESQTANSIKIRNMKALEGTIDVVFTSGTTTIRESVVLSK